MITAGALLAGGVIGQYQYRWRLRRAIRKSAERHPARTIEPSDTDAMMRIIKDHQGPR